MLSTKANLRVHFHVCPCAPVGLSVSASCPFLLFHGLLLPHLFSFHLLPVSWHSACLTHPLPASPPACQPTCPSLPLVHSMYVIYTHNPFCSIAKFFYLIMYHGHFPFNSTCRSVRVSFFFFQYNCYEMNVLIFNPLMGNSFPFFSVNIFFNFYTFSSYIFFLCVLWVLCCCTLVWVVQNCEICLLFYTLVPVEIARALQIKTSLKSLVWSLQDYIEADSL